MKSLDKKKPGWRKMTADDLRRGIDLSKTISGFRVIETKSDKKKSKSSEGKGIKEYKRGYSVSVDTGWFKKPVITITDGVQVVKFAYCGTFVIETDKEFPIPLIIPD
jgi:hypothetical protein